MDGKRRRLRRKRAASPDSPYGEAFSDAAAPASDEGPADGDAAEGIAGGSESSSGGGQAAGSPRCSGAKATAVQRVIRQVSKLSINTPTAAAAPGDSPARAAAPLAPAQAPGGGAAAPPQADIVPRGAHPVGGVAQPDLRQGLLDSLSLVHDLSQVRLQLPSLF